MNISEGVLKKIRLEVEEKHNELDREHSKLEKQAGYGWADERRIELERDMQHYLWFLSLIDKYV